MTKPSSKPKNLKKKKKTAEIHQMVPSKGNKVQVEICGKSISCLIDTGAAISCCSLRLIEFLRIDTGEIKKSFIEEAMGVGGEVHSIIGVISLSLVIGNVVFEEKFHVFEKMQQQMILGWEFLKSNRINIFPMITQFMFRTRKQTQLMQLS